MGKFLDRLEEYLLACLLAFMTLITFTQVVLRYLFNTGLVWSLEATTYAFAALVLIGMSYVARVRSHIAVDIVTRKLTPKLRRITCLVAVFACLTYTCLMFYGSWLFVDGLQMLGNNARDIPLPKWLLTASMPFGFLLLGFRFVQAGAAAWRGDTDVLLNSSSVSPLPSLESEK